MLFDDITTEEKLEKLKCLIMSDEKHREGFLAIRRQCARDYGPDLEHVGDAIDEKRMPSNAEVLAYYKDLIQKGEQESLREVERILRKMKVRSNSGVAVVSLLTKPYECPGKCIYCPDEKAMPKSYLSKEPAAARALANNFSPYTQVQNRMRALAANGHPIDKLEVIVIGGTWSFYDEEYQEEFISGIFRAANDFGKDEDIKKMNAKKTLEELQLENETADCRIIGLSVETRPDHINEKELDRLRWLGVTKIEIGVQHLDDKILTSNKRNMGVKRISEATELMRNAGFKVVYHMMPNLPGSNKEMDIKMFGDLFNGKEFQPDMLKMYPCMVLRGSELHSIWERGEFTPYTDEELLYVLREAKKQVPKYVRVLRVIRDIPGEYILAGSKISNLRQFIQEDQKKNNWRCKCIRCREVRNEEVSLDDYVLERIEYATLTGKEIFLSFEHKTDNKCAAFCRLRLPNEDIASSFLGNLKVLHGAAIIRELHTYGQLVGIKKVGDQSQHRGLGMRLMNEAERIAKEAGYERMAVISGVGVREYYRKKLGYTLEGTYMVKRL
ncbi:MAG: elongator complex protein 3 [Patescibacteria group bacterium]